MHRGVCELNVLISSAKACACELNVLISSTKACDSLKMSFSRR